jgi:PST family polysaccharide transporter
VLKLKENLKTYRTLVSNLTSLSVLQASNYLFPLIILPYVVRVLGPENYGLVQFAAAFNLYFVLLCDYGFNLSGTRAVSVNRNDENKLSQIFSSILIIKVIMIAGEKTEDVTQKLAIVR